MFPFIGVRAARLPLHRRIPTPSSVSEAARCRLLLTRPRRAHYSTAYAERRPFSSYAGMQAADNVLVDEHGGLTLARGSRFNTADRIVAHLREDGHCVWGMAIYRCTYEDEAAWQTCLSGTASLPIRLEIQEAARAPGLLLCN